MLKSPTVDWKIALAHDLAIRNALVACGNPAPKIPDPEGCVIRVECRIFKGKEYWESMNKAGHDSAEIDKCSCLTGRPLKRLIVK